MRRSDETVWHAEPWAMCANGSFRRGASRPYDRELGEKLDRLIHSDCPARLVVNLGGVGYLSCAVLGKLAWLAKRVGPVRGRVSRCGVSPLLVEMVRITHLDRVLDIDTDEAEALGPDHSLTKKMGSERPCEIGEAAAPDRFEPEAP